MSPPFPGIAWDRLPDEELLAYVYSAAHARLVTTLLWERHQTLLQHLTRAVTRRQRLRPPDTEDVDHEAFLAFLEALRGFDPAAGVHFGTFLWQVVQRHLRNWLRSGWRSERRLDRSVPATVVLELRGGGTSGDEGWLQAPDSRQGDPVAAVTWRELWDRLEQAKQQLAPTQRQLLEDLCAGQPLAAWAAGQGLSVDQVKRRKKHLLAGLAAALGVVPPAVD